MADYLTPQDVIDAKVDSHTLEVAVNGTAAQTVTPRLGGSYHTLAYYFEQLEVIKNNTQLSADQKLAAMTTYINGLNIAAQQKLDIINGLVATGNTEITNLQSAINTAAAAGAGANGWTALVVQDASGKNQQQINDLGIAPWRNVAYPINARVMLDNGDSVQSTIAVNAANPNTDMTGWLLNKQYKTVSTMANLRLSAKPKNGDMVLVESYYAADYSLANPTDGSGFFVWDSASTAATTQGIIEQITGVPTGRFKRVINDGIINVLWCGAKRNGITETHSALTIALQYAINNNMQCYAPTGTYLIGGRVDPTFTNGKSLYFFGDGSEHTIFKERNGLTLELGRFNMTFYFLCPDNTTVNTISIKNMRVNKNGVTSPAPSPTDYMYEQAHCFALASGWTSSRIKNMIMDDVVTEDKIGGGVVLTQGYFDDVMVNGIRGVNYQHSGGQRGDFEFQAVVTNGVATNCSGKYTQCEPNLATVPTGYNPRFVFEDCTYDVTEFTAYINSHDAQTIILENHTAKELCLIRYAKIIAKNSTLLMRSSSNTFWEGTAKGSILEDCKTLVGINTTTNATDPFYLKSGANAPTFLKIKGGAIVPEGTINATTTGFAISNASVYSGAQEYLVELEDVNVDTRFERTINCYANGNYRIKNTKLAGRAGSLAAIAIGGYSTNYANVELDGNDLSQLGGAYVQYTTSNTLWSVNYKGVHDFAKSGYTSSNLAQTETQAKADGHFTSDTVPTGKGIVGWRVRINKPVFGAPSEFICTTTHSVTPVYQLLNQTGVKLDTTANRPSGLTAAYRGLRYLDTTLAAGGKPIQYNGTAWVDSTGTVV